MKYDLHVHSHYSRCSPQTPEAILTAAKHKKLDGIAVTDHNTIQGAREVAKKNTDPSFEVIIGSEILTDEGGEIIGLFLSKDITPGPAERVIEDIHKQGGFAVAAHPRDVFRHHFRRVSAHLDALEVCNGRCTLPFFNTGAKRRMRKGRFASTGGSDGHFSFEIGRVVTEVDTDVAQAIQNRRTKVKGSTWHAIPGTAFTILYRLKRLSIDKLR